MTLRKKSKDKETFSFNRAAGCKVAGPNLRFGESRGRASHEIPKVVQADFRAEEVGPVWEKM